MKGDALDQAGEDVAVACLGLLARLTVLQDEPPPSWAARRAKMQIDSVWINSKGFMSLMVEIA